MFCSSSYKFHFSGNHKRKYVVDYDDPSLNHDKMEHDDVKNSVEM